MASQSIRQGGSPENCLLGGGEMGEFMRAHDWSATPLGAVDQWPQSLRTSVSTCLNSRFAIVIWWGPDLLMLYNDAYREIIGSKHPAALGRPGRNCFPEIWHIVGPMLDNVLYRGEATLSNDLPLYLERHGYPEECYFTFSYSPIRDESGGVGGVFTPVAETTEKVIGARRLHTLQELTSRSRTARDVETVCRRAAETLSANPHDVPYSAIYLYGDDRRRGERVAGSGSAGQELPQTIVFPAGPDSVIAGAAERARFEQIAWPSTSDVAVVLPLAASSQSAPAGFFVAGVNPSKRLDASYRTFFALAAGQIAAGIGEARAYEEERRRAEALAELDRAKTMFFSNISHEFRTPLTLMLGPLENALGADAAALSGEDLSLVHRNGQRLLKLVNTLLDFSRLEAGRLQACYEPVDLATLTSDIASGFRYAMEKSGLRYVVDCAALSEPVYVDREMWEKIVLNLLSNALKFTLSGAVEIALRQTEERAELTVRDTGIGIAESELPRVFDRFHRIEGARGRTHEGSGIGLALVHELVKLHGGEVRAASTPGQGSAFTVSIPLGRAHLPADGIRARPAPAPAGGATRSYVEEALRWIPGAPAEEPAREAAPAARPRILVAEDNADMRDYLRRMLDDRYELVLVPDGEAAAAALQTGDCDLVLSDVMMPRLDGFGLIRRIRDDPRTCLLPVILLSARAGEESSIEGLQAGADAYLVKPFSARELAAQIESHLAISRLRRAAGARERELLREAEVERLRWRALLEFAPASMALLRGPDLEFEIVNDEYARASGRPGAAYFRGKRLRDALPELVPQGYIETLMHVYRTGEPVFGRRRLVRLDRAGDGNLEDRYFNCAYQPARNAAGEIEGVLIHAVDVTEEVVAQRRLEESQRQLRSLADSIPNLAWIADAGGARIWFNRRWREYTGLREEETAGWGWMQVHDPDQASQIVERYKRQIESGDFWEDTVRLRGKTGEYRWFLSRAIPIRGSDGRPVRWFGTSTDVTTEMEARDRLRQSEERATSRASELQAIMDAVPAAIYIAREPDCRELIGNRAAREWLGLSPAEPVRDPLRAAVRDVRPVYNYECEVASEDGSRKALLGNTVPLLDDQGHSRGGVAAFIDVTESRRMQDRLREAQRLESVGLLAGGVAHDFNNLLVPILGYAGVARDTLELSSPVQPLLAEIERAAERAAHLTRQMLAYAGKARFVIQQIDVEKVARETVSLLRVSISKDISIAVHAEPPIPAVDADPAEVEQVLMNLLLNAAEAIGDGPGTIEIRLAAEDLAGPEAAGFQVASDIAPGRYVRVEVTDTGCGMDAETRAKIFEPFFSTKFLGRGLGLAAVAGIVRAHGWGLRVTSAPGEGSTFQVFLHAARAEAARPPAASAEATVDPSGSGSVLVVDDEDVVLQTAKLALERHGYRVFLARSGADAVRLYQGEARDVDLVLLDLGMPGMNGHETLVALQEINPDVRALISSGYSESEALEPFAGQKTVGFMQKPYAAGQLASAVKKALRDRPSPSGRASA